jgi:hypothetical protein
MSMDEYWDWSNELMRLNELAKRTKSVDTLKELATSDDWGIRFNVMYNRYSTEDVVLSVYAYNKFRKLTKWK